MKIGIIGLGKLGLPVALAIENAGHEVRGWDVKKSVRQIILSRELPYIEEGAQELLDTSDITLDTPDSISEWADVIFVAAQTPHQPEFEGITKLPRRRADFDYTWLKKAVSSVSDAKLVVVISTVLPGTIEREIKPLISEEHFLYNPFFIAMGTTIPDFCNPEFVLVGTDHAHPGPLKDLYATIHDSPVFVTTVRSAELTKVLYNTFIGLKIAFANTVMELAHKTGADCDEIIDALSLADQRIISPMYLRGGMGDGGGCHPRDNIALSWLAQKLDLSYDLFESLMLCREKQTEWLADLLAEEEGEIELMGMAYKPETNLTTGSPSLLLASLLTERGIRYNHTDPFSQ